jgi:hypothetical protein
VEVIMINVWRTCLGVEMATAAMAEEAQAEAMTQALSSRDKSD